MKKQIVIISMLLCPFFLFSQVKVIRDVKTQKVTVQVEPLKPHIEEFEAFVWPSETPSSWAGANAVTAVEQPTISQLNQSIAEIRMDELTVKAKPGEQITIEQVRHQFWFGCVLDGMPFGGNDGWPVPMSESEKKQYRNKFLENFNSAAVESIKWFYMEREKGIVNYSVVDAILDWTKENEIPLRGACIYWGAPWGDIFMGLSRLKEMDDKELEKTLKNRGKTIAARYKGRFAVYDLNNEMIHGNYYEQRLGPGITKKMAQWVRKGDPGAKLFLNDFDITTGVQLSKYVAQIRTLLQQGVPIAGVGVQGHLHAETFDRQQLQNALDTLAQFKLPIVITEFNIPGQSSKYYFDGNLKMTAEEEARNAKELVDFYRICFAHPSVTGILMWGFWERANWIPASSMYREDWSITPTGEAYRDLIFREWWTNKSGEADRNGSFSTPAFYGKYKITAGGVTKMVDFVRRMTVDFRAGAVD
jgi:GH35 family endo-1,4-beta-xylanase